jgi:hypothetical protein
MIASRIRTVMSQSRPRTGAFLFGAHRELYLMVI